MRRAQKPENSELNTVFCVKVLILLLSHSRYLPTRFIFDNFREIISEKKNTQLKY